MFVATDTGADHRCVPPVVGYATSAFRPGEATYTVLPTTGGALLRLPKPLFRHCGDEFEVACAVRVPEVEVAYTVVPATTTPLTASPTSGDHASVSPGTEPGVSVASARLAPVPAGSDIQD